MNLGKETTYREAERRCFLNYFSGRHKSEIGVKAKLDSEMMKTTTRVKRNVTSEMMQKDNTYM